MLAYIGILCVAVILILIVPVRTVEVGGFDYFVSIRRLPWAAARVDCQKRGGSLAYITNDTIQIAVAAQMANTKRDDAWISGKTKRVDWHWTDGSVIAPQGCWQDTVTNVDMQDSRGVASVTPSGCITACERFKYAGIKKSAECFCADSYGSLGASHSCGTPCTETDDGDCGGTTSNSVFFVQGSWAGWNVGYPKTDTDRAMCATADLLGYYKYSTVCCNETWHYMCQLDPVHCQGNNDSRYYFMLNDKCVRLSMSMKNWYESRATCIDLGGDLLKIETEAIHSELLKQMKNVRFGMKYYVGLTEMESKWIEPTAQSDLIYTNWGSAGIYSNGTECILISAAAGYTWTNADCSKKKYYVCQLKSIAIPGEHTTPSWLRLGGITEDPNTILHPPNDFNQYDNWMKAHGATVSPGGNTAPMSGSMVAVLVILTLVVVGALLFGIYFYARTHGSTPFQMFEKEKQASPDYVFSSDTENQKQAGYGTVYAGDAQET